MKITVLALALISFALTSLGAIHYREDAPQSQRHGVIKHPPLSTGLDPHRKGEEAEKAVAALFKAAGYFECPAKYSSFGNPDATYTAYPQENNGLDGLFVRFQTNRKGQVIRDKKGNPIIDYLVVNESKFQSKGGAPKLGKMGCFTCSGGPSKDEYEQTQQMSWRWIHNAVEQAAKKGANGCRNSSVKEACALVCPAVLGYLASDMASIVRTASVMDAEGNMGLYSLFDTRKEQLKANSVLQELFDGASQNQKDAKPKNPRKKTPP